jgi:hypothetical protein
LRSGREYGFDDDDAFMPWGTSRLPDLTGAEGRLRLSRGRVDLHHRPGRFGDKQRTCDPVILGWRRTLARSCRYIAAVGYDGDPTTDDCDGVGTGNSCGNYYFAEEGFELEAVFEAIASRIFTRITH